MTERQPSALSRLITRISFSPFRLVAYALHATGLEHFYKPRFIRHTALLDITPELVANLPKYCYSMTGARMDPMNLVFVATEVELKRMLKKAGWHRANPASPVHLFYGFLTVITRRSYKTGPFTPFYVNIALQDLAYQQVTRAGSFKQRHHMRIWRTGAVLPNDKLVWVAAASYDVNLKIQLTPPFIHHRIDPNIDGERAFVTKSLERRGALRLKSIPMTEPTLASAPASNAYGADYFTDGRADVIQL